MEMLLCLCFMGLSFSKVPSPSWHIWYYQKVTGGGITLSCRMDQALEDVNRLTTKFWRFNTSAEHRTIVQLFNCRHHCSSVVVTFIFCHKFGS